MPLRIGTVPLEKVFKKLEPADNEDTYWSPMRTNMPMSVIMKYPNIRKSDGEVHVPLLYLPGLTRVSMFPAATYSWKCVKGEKNVNRYYYRFIPRSMHSIQAINMRMPNAPVQPTFTDDTQMYSPRYITYNELEVG